jgi:uncharacterized cupin superfamily protein
VQGNYDAARPAIRQISLLKKIPELAFLSSNSAFTSDPINPAWILEGTPSARVNVLAVGSDGSAWTCIWDCSAGKFNWFYSFDETVYILDGSVTLFGGTQQERTLKPGDMYFFPKGSQAHWHVEDHVRKLAFCHTILPDVITVPISFMKKMLRPNARAGLGA